MASNGIEQATPSIVGINFGNSYASIAVFTKEGLAECIANEDGERQIASAISFHGEELYIGNQAKAQLVKNAKNTITGFRNLLGKKFSEIPQSQSSTSAPVIQHPDIPDEPAYRVQILQPAPAPLPASTNHSSYTTPLASHAATPRSEPIPAERILTVSEVTSIFLKSLLSSAQDFLGKPIQGAVITLPTWFSPSQKIALQKAATDAGINVLQLLEEPSAVAATTTTPLWSESGGGGSPLPPDRTQLIVDLGASSLSLTLLSIREGLAYILASTSSHANTDVGGDKIDTYLIKFFASEFTKKTKIPLDVNVRDTNTADGRALAKLRAALEHTKRTISASPGAATCSVESLKEGYDFTGSINRLRFDLVVKAVYGSVGKRIMEMLSEAGRDAHEVDEVVYVGGTTSLPGLDECLRGMVGLREDVETPFSRGTVGGGGIGDPTTVLARGCAVQAALIVGVEDEVLKKAFDGEMEGEGLNKVVATSRTVGVLFPGGGGGGGGEGGLGGTWVPVVLKETAVPARRKVQVDVGLTDTSKTVLLEVWEVEEGIRVEKVKPMKEFEDDDDDDDDDDEEEEVEVKHKTLEKHALMGVLKFEAENGIKAKGKGKDAGKWTTSVQVQVVVEVDGTVSVDVEEVGGGGGKSKEGGGGRGGARFSTKSI